MLSLLQSLIDFFTSPQLMIGLVWTGMAALTVALVVVMRTQWGHQQPLRKCVVLSLFAHLLFVAYATTVHIVRTHPHGANGTAIRITALVGSDSIDSPGAVNGVDGGRQTAPWDAASEAPPVEPKLADLPPDESLQPRDNIVPIDHAPVPFDSVAGPVHAEPPLPALESSAPAPQPSPEPIDVAATQQPPAPQTDAPAVEMESPADLETPQPTSADLTKLVSAPAAALAATLPLVEAVDALAANEDAARAASPVPAHEADAGALVAVQPRPTTVSTAGTSRRTMGANALAPASAVPVASGPHTVPEMYRERAAADRLRIAESFGGSAQTEAAVNAALDWLVNHQAADGRWDASDHGAGRETLTLGQDRKGAGAQADTGLTGLALLAFLGAGHTHQSGAHAETVKRGLQFLIASQATDGNLAGRAESYAMMYCHGMAALAISEASAMTGDDWLARPLRRAISYTLAAQNLASGGWRYKPNERGDTSILGWQLMALKSAEFSGLAIPERSRQGIIRYLNSVSSGARGGLASYRPDERPTHPMTAEALVCREFLDLSLAGAGDEARDFLLNDLPGRGPANFYYWYYGTLAMFRLQGPRWTKWNEAISTTLTHSQLTAGDASGSWDPDPLWGGYGGRVFSTSLGALCLEVYYRYLPLYNNTGGRDNTAGRDKSAK